MPLPALTVSVVSHGQNELMRPLLHDLEREYGRDLALVVTQNIPEPAAPGLEGLGCVHELIVNPRPKGFGANHNAAFARCRTEFFCVVNPDVRLRGNPFPALIAAASAPDVGVAGPLVRSPAGGVEDSARRFPTPRRLLAKIIEAQHRSDYPPDRGPLTVDWVAGMFMLFRSEAFRRIGGFDEAYFLYYEDVDLCFRLRRAGLASVYEPRAEVVHDARRASRRSARLALHHGASMLRFLARQGLKPG